VANTKNRPLSFATPFLRANPFHRESGSYTYTKTGENTATLDLSDGTTVQFAWTAPDGGNYLVPQSGQTGTFTNTW